MMEGGLTSVSAALVAFRTGRRDSGLLSADADEGGGGGCSRDADEEV